MINIYNGNFYMEISKESPYWSNCSDKIIKAYRVFKIYFAIRKRNVTGLNQRAINICKKVFGNDCEILNYVVKCNNGNVYYLDDCKFIFNGDYWDITNNPYVFFNVTKNKFVGYSHRGHGYFGRGDMLFDIDKEDESFYYNQKEFRNKFIERLKYYNKHNDVFLFEDLIHDGIKNIVPFRKRGNKIIETWEDAERAASNFAKYLD